MRLGITGATGFIGGAILREAKKRRWETVGFSRNPNRAVENCDELRDFSVPAEADLSNLDAVVHLAGESIAGLWTKEKKRRILDSRVNGTKDLVAAISNVETEKRPRVLVSASGIGIYGDCGDSWVDESSDIGFGFLADVCRQWESAAVAAESVGLRVVMPRIGIVLGTDGGILEKTLGLFRLGLGGRLGSGEQWMSWIHVEDVARVFLHLIDCASSTGPVNCVAPQPVTNAAFTDSLAVTLGKKANLPVPEFVFHTMPGGMKEMFLSSQRVATVELKAFDFSWNHGELGAALQDILKEK